MTNYIKEIHTSEGTRKIADLGSVTGIDRLPFSIRILLENVMRNIDGLGITEDHYTILSGWDSQGTDSDIPYKPARVLMQDFTGVPAIVDIASIRSEVIRKGKDGSKINPLIPVDLVVDHSVQVDFFGTEDAYEKNVAKEYERNHERYSLLKWGQNSFDNFGVVPPGMGICHQVNLEYLAQGVVDRDGWLFPDTLVGTDSHTPMVNGIGVLGWGVGGIEAEAAMLGQPIYFTCPQVIGLELTGRLGEGITATDMVLAITELLRKYGVVGKFVEVFGDGLDHLTVPDRATISNMSPEFGCTATYFPIDDQTIDYMRRTNRPDEVIERVISYTRKNHLWRTGNEEIEYSDVISMDLSSLEPTVSGPKRPQDKILVRNLKEKFYELINKEYDHRKKAAESAPESNWLGEGGSLTEFVHAENQIQKVRSARVKYNGEEFVLHDGSIVIAAITSCTNTSNPSVMVGAGLVARKAREKGLNVKPWVKTSLAPGSKVVTRYLERSGLDKALEEMRFNTVGYGCTSCIGNSGPLPEPIAKAVTEHELNVSSVLSGNRNFEARVHPQVRMNFLASPMLVVVYAIAGRVNIDLMTEPIGYDMDDVPVFMKDIWPTMKEIQEVMKTSISREDFAQTYSVIFDGEAQWQDLPAPSGLDYRWSDDSTYIKEAPFFKNISEFPSKSSDIIDARVLLKLADSITTDHISPAGAFSPNSPAGQYLLEQGVEYRDFNSYGSRRGNHEVMMRGTFANVRIKNELGTKEGGFTTYLPGDVEMSVFDASMKYQSDGTDLIVIAGKEYGSGSSRDWAAKGTTLLGIRAVIAESYERIHRSNLVGMGVLPLQFLEGESASVLGLTGREIYSIRGIEEGLEPGKVLSVVATGDGNEKTFDIVCRLDSRIEIEYYKNGGILHYVLRNFLAGNV
ncbi:aconitate hydratase AcnA [Fulvivirga sedimenti]|uniref:Aconitate hydratase n=1 Tax=Fulvivirga sedimenti TaxID=2879465 RepID=A0A9X1HPQ2_9BACT|nr:aconitate hydratase AcnA [Fulvivirga sedimenti]MCA6074905.1 aconitate hydratase AcnA [Fulvivirga sedimenti]MCA6076082.1 aconitate hydratase AcnA [Fulvivirga sedimenti]MCA6077210.1 aconitate hydratase AcnA [Fulvivirga sedimenti]